MGEYFNFAIDWQHGLGCKVAGFITVFSSELSIYTLTIITLERYFPIAYPLQINKRLKLSFVFKVMLAGWLYSILMASLPLPFMGISSYSKTSICLPMETRNAYDYAYLIFILCFSAIDFVLIGGCYGKMYLSIISQKTRATNNDMKVAKGMAMLVFTDFACLVPIIFFGEFWTKKLIIEQTNFHTITKLNSTLLFHRPHSSRWLSPDRRDQIEDFVSLLFSAQLDVQSVLVHDTDQTASARLLLADLTLWIRQGIALSSSAALLASGLPRLPSTSTQRQMPSNHRFEHEFR